MKRQLQDISNQDGHCSQKRETRSPEVRQRRVEMEKRRRDKINYYLNELAELVPAAAEKRGTTKLEKAEVLELTLDHVRNVVKEKKCENGRKPDNVQICAEKERRRGFLACLHHISQFLEKSESLLESNEKLIFCLKSFLSCQNTTGEESNLSRRRDHIYDSYLSKRNDTNSGDHTLMTHENVFYKICVDFLKNNSYSQPTDDGVKQVENVVNDDYCCWPDTADCQEQLTLSCENLDSSYDLVPPYGSFMSLLNGYY